jgi:hypothetical protein
MKKRKYKRDIDDFDIDELDDFYPEEAFENEYDEDEEDSYLNLTSQIEKKIKQEEELNQEAEEDESTEDEEKEEDEIEEIINEPIKIKSTDKKKFYVDPKEFDTEIMSFYSSGVMSNNLAEMISKISHKLSYASNFINYSYREEMVGDGVVRMLKALLQKKYDKSKGTNPFSYFTRIAFNAFRNRIKKEKHIHETHEKYKEELALLSSNYNNVVKNKNTSANKKYF